MLCHHYSSSFPIPAFNKIQSARLLTSRNTLVISALTAAGSNEFSVAAFRHSEKQVATALTSEVRTDVTLQIINKCNVTNYNYT
jgi:hypothetical protein